VLGQEFYLFSSEDTPAKDLSKVCTAIETIEMAMRHGEYFGDAKEKTQDL